jgi:hypothetical protein
MIDKRGTYRISQLYKTFVPGSVLLFWEYVHTAFTQAVVETSHPGTSFKDSYVKHTHHSLRAIGIWAPP